ncbi:MAG TPA: ABC transporter substrate-binding protein [Mycolicibacillus parakoreensis]|nr:ABC transporter substrate-binding protein [Mycolicibacillus parakoreensis]
MALRRALVVAVSCALLLALGPTACSSLGSKRLDYVVDGALVTYNTNTVAGAASAGAQAFARTLTGFSYHGPNGQVVADYDFGAVAEVGRAPLILDYTIDDDAVYSDGVPITCDDMVLTWAAQSGRFPAFDAANRAGYADIVRVDCQPGEKKAQVHFAESRNFSDYDELFTATSILPAHVIADQMEIDRAELTTILLGVDLPVIEEIAQLWNTTWDLHPGIDPAHFPSSGPYRIDAVRDDGAVVLVANERWWKIAPLTKQITVSTQGGDIQDRVDDRDIDVLDIATGSAGPLTTPDNYRQLDTPADGIEQLIFAPAGPLAAPEARRAVALCTPRDVIAANAEVPVANARLQTTLDDALSGAEGASEAGEFTFANPDAARAELGDTPLAVRIGYHAPNSRLAVAVDEIAKACGPAGITVTDAGGIDVGPRSMRDGDIDILIGSLGGASGSGSSGSPGVDSYSLHTGNGNNLSGYANGQIDFIIGALAVVVSPAERVRLLAEAAPVLWADMPTLPLYRQQRTVLTNQKMDGVTANPTRWGAGWNMDRWALKR